ncbi:hypothetical protein GCM10007863_40930 [Dyella mobilis]|nr:hypothetical protein GCM10007863_40930 [Dyella mobilis]
MWNKLETWPTLLKQLGVAGGYIAVFACIRPLSDAHWSLTAGLRLSALLLFPYRYWFALALGDGLYSLPQAIECEPQFGFIWSLQYPFPLTAVAMPVVWYCKEKLALFPTKRLINFNTLILCSLACSTLWSLYNAAGLWLIPHRGYSIDAMLFGSLLIGSYVALLTIVPWIIMAKLGYRAGTLKKGLHTFFRSPIFFDTGLVVLPALLILSWLTYRSAEATKPIWALFEFAPVAWLTLRHGWRGTVMGGTMTVASICLLFSWGGNIPDADVVQVQAIIAFSITCLLAMGARISAMHQADEVEKTNARQALQLARQSMLVSELRMRQASETLEQVVGEMQINSNRLLSRFRLMLPANESQTLTKQAVTAQEKVYKLADSMHPIAWRRRGMSAALKENIGRALDEMGIAYQCKVTGRGLSQVGNGLHTMIYRLAREAVVYVCGNLHCSRVSILLRGAYVDGQRIVALRVEGLLEDGLANDSFVLEGQQNQLASKLGATGLDLHQLRDNARLFDGELHVRANPKSLRITTLLIDAAQKEKEHSTSSPFRLWAG